MPVPPELQRKKNARARIRSNGHRMQAAFEVLYKPIAEWDMDELARGRPRASDGTWKGGTPHWLTPALRDEAKRRLMTEGRSMLQTHLVDAIKVVHRLATDEDTDDDGKPVVPASVRLQAAGMIIEQVLGKATARVEVDATENLRDMLAGALVLPSGDPAVIIEGEVIYSEEDDDDEAPVSGDES